MKKQEKEALVTKVEMLEREIYKLYRRLENNKIDKHVYTVAETAQILGKTPQAVYLMIARGELESVKLGHLSVLGETLRAKLGVQK